MSTGIKYDSNKVRASILPGWRALKPIAEVMQWAVESKGYPVGNWKHVEPERYRDALARHFFAWLDNPRGKDEQSNRSHLAHLGCNVLFLLWLGDHEGDRDG